MKRVTALLLDDSDFTRDSNIRRAAFEAICIHEVVLYGDQVVKNRYSEITQTLPAMRGKLAMQGQQALDLSSPLEAALTEEDDASSTTDQTETLPPDQADFAEAKS